MPAAPLPSLPRRHTLRCGLGLAAASLGWPAIAASRQRLPAMTEGPFYPVERPLDDDADLTRVQGRPPARGEWLDIEGVVLDTRQRVIDGAEIEIWQCDVHGSYRHPRGAGDQVDAGFQGFGATTSDGRGAYRFRTIRPVPYSGRAPHIHLKLRHASFGEITSQWFVNGDPGNERDFLFRQLSAEQRGEVMLALRRAGPEAAGRPVVLWQARREIVVPG